MMGNFWLLFSFLRRIKKKGLAEGAPFAENKRNPCLTKYSSFLNNFFTYKPKKKDQSKPTPKEKENKTKQNKTKQNKTKQNKKPDQRVESSSQPCVHTSLLSPAQSHDCKGVASLTNKCPFTQTKIPLKQTIAPLKQTIVPLAQTKMSLSRQENGN